MADPPRPQRNVHSAHTTRDGEAAARKLMARMALDTRADDTTRVRADGPQAESSGALPDPLLGVQEMLAAWTRWLTERLHRMSQEAGEPLRKSLGPHGVPSMHATLSAAERIISAGPKWRDHRPPLYTWDDLLRALCGYARTPVPLAADCVSSVQDGKNYRTHTLHVPNARVPGVASARGLIGVSLATPTLEQLRAQFADLAPEHRQFGLDDKLHPWFMEDHLLQGQRVLASASPSSACLFARRGVPPGLRARLWSLALGIETSSSAHHHRGRAYFEALCAAAEGEELFMDGCVLADVTYVRNHPEFFLFEDCVRAVLLAFLRDATITPPLPTPMIMLSPAPGAGTSILTGPGSGTSTGSGSGIGDSRGSGHTPKGTPSRQSTPRDTQYGARSPPNHPSRPPSSGGKEKEPMNGGRDAHSPDTRTPRNTSGATAPTYYPPSGVVPPPGFSLIAAVLAYVHSRPDDLYFTLRALHTAFFCRLHTISSLASATPGGSPSSSTIDAARGGGGSHLEGGGSQSQSHSPIQSHTQGRSHSQVNTQNEMYSQCHNQSHIQGQIHSQGQTHMGPGGCTQKPSRRGTHPFACPSLLGLCKLFEDVLLANEPDAFFHAAELGAHPLQMALPWIGQAFAGYLPVEEVLLLWDRVIGFHSLTPVALLAAAVFMFRRSAVLACRSAEEVVATLADLSQLKTVPLLQHVLFS
eukprot:jgi/Mesvir1/5268/Mv15381-RA.1